MGGLGPVDDNWYCDNCNNDFAYEVDFLFCPCCGNVLKNDQYLRDLKSIEEFFCESTVTICEDCGDEFDGSFKFCPLCSKELKKINIPTITIEKDNSVTTDWNGEKVWIFDKDMFLSSPHFAAITVKDCFEWKDDLDYKLESDFKKLDLEPPQKLSYKETYSLFDLRGAGIIVRDIMEFMPTYNEDEDDKPHRFNHVKVIKIRHDLYVKLCVDYVQY